MNVRDVCKWCVVAALAALGTNFGLNKASLRTAGPGGCRGRSASAHARAGTRGLRGNGDVRSRAGHRGDDGAAGGHRGIAARPATGGGQRGVDPRVLGLGRRAERLPVGQRHLARPAARPPMGARVLGQGRARLPVDVRVLGRRRRDRGGILARAAGDGRSRSEHCRHFGGPNVGCPARWVWHQRRYAWRPGYWAAVQPNWVWVPAHYVYAPRGYVFVDGYWDYSIGRRGVLFAPVYFHAGVYARRGFSYSPSIAIDLGVFASHLFLRPRYQHYYFGDYYAAQLPQRRVLPVVFLSTPAASATIRFYAHNRWQHRQDRQWERRVAADFQNRRDHENLRPPRTWEAQRALGATAAVSRDAEPRGGRAARATDEEQR